MPSITDILTSLFKGAGHSDEDAAAQAAELSGHPNASNATSPLMPPSSFDVGTSDNTVTQNGSLPSVSVDGPLAPTPTGGGQPASGVSGSWDAPTSPTPPLISPPVISPPAPSVTAPPAQTPVSSSPITTPASNDNASRETELARLEHQKKMNLIPGLIGGLGDATAKGLSAFGMKLPSDTQNQILERGKETEESGKKDFELKLQNDPTSDVSKSYRQMVLQIAPNLAQQPNFQNMSAKDIGDKLPLIDTMMKAQASKDAKEIGLKQAQATRANADAMKEQTRQDKLEKETREWVDNLAKARNGQVGQQDGKVNQSMHLLQLMDQYKDAQGNYKIPNSQYSELALGMANLVSPTGTATEGTRHAIEQATAKGDLNKLLTYTGLDPKTLGGSTESIFQNLRDSIERQGALSEQLRNKYLNDQKETAPSGLHPEQRDRLLNHTYGNSVVDYVKTSRNKPIAPEGSRKTASGTTYSIRG